jgi:hypothetical protein
MCNSIGKINQTVGQKNFFNSRYQTVLVAVQIYSDNLFDAIRTLNELLVLPATRLLSGDVSKAWKKFRISFIEELHHIKKAVTLPFFFLAAIVAPVRVWAAAAKAFPRQE